MEAGEAAEERQALLAGAEAGQAGHGVYGGVESGGAVGNRQVSQCSSPRLDVPGTPRTQGSARGSQPPPILRRTSSLRVPGKSLSRAGEEPGDTPGDQPKQEWVRSAFWTRLNKMWRGPVVDSMTYKGDVLTSWNALFNLQGVTTAFQSPSAWDMMYRLMMLSFFIGVLMLLFVPNPAKMKTSKFQKIAVFLRVFVGLLLGFFLTSSVNRWFECTRGFLELYDAIRNLQMQLLALGAPKELRNSVVRYSVVSGWLLGMTLQIESMPDDEKEVAVEEMYESLRDDEEVDTAKQSVDTRARYTILEEEEIVMLKGVADPASMMWIWVASLVGRMAQDGWVPGMQTPTYGLLMCIVQEAHAAIRNVRQSIWVQAPFIYVHMLASLVHVNNIVNAISFGIVLGSSIGTSLQFFNIEIYSNSSGEKDLIADCENLIVSFVICVVGPFLYQILLEVSICISQPFGSGQSEIPTDRLLEKLQRDLSDATRMATSVPAWRPPCFKELPPPPTLPQVREDP